MSFPILVFSDNFNYRNKKIIINPVSCQNKKKINQICPNMAFNFHVVRMNQINPNKFYHEIQFR